MVIAISGVLSVVPQIIIATIIAAYFYYSTRHTESADFMKNERKGGVRKQVQAGIQKGEVITPDSDPQMRRISRQVPFNSSARVSDTISISRFILTIVLWAGALVVFSEPTYESKFIPILGSPLDYVIYLPLGVLVVISLASFISFNFHPDFKRKIAMIAVCVIFTVGFFYTPGLSGFFFNKFLFIILVIYIISLLTGILVYLCAFYFSRRFQWSLSILTAVLSYVYLLGLFVTKSMSVIFHI